MEDGCQKYGDRNWEKGIPICRYLDSAMRHTLKYLGGMTDEPHLVAACWNLLCALETEHRVEIGMLPKELDDRPTPSMVMAAPQLLNACKMALDAVPRNGNPLADYLRVVIAQAEGK
jgi:hypothetical protein